MVPFVAGMLGDFVRRLGRSDLILARILSERASWLSE